MRTFSFITCSNGNSGMSVAEWYVLLSYKVKAAALPYLEPSQT